MKLTSWIPTHSGRRLDPSSPDPDAIVLTDIAHALSHQCRYAGHVIRHYSTAEHSVRLSHVVPTKYRIAALLHDATEAYMVDIPSPIKRQPYMKGYRRLEDQLLAIIFEKYKVGMLEVDQSLKVLDRRICGLEAKNLFVYPGNLPFTEDWSDSLEEMEKELKSSAKLRNWGWEPPYAKIQFLDRAAELGVGDVIAEVVQS